MIKQLLILVFGLFTVTRVLHAEEEKFVVGMILPLSGELADYGAALRNGFELAAEERPDLFSHISLRYEDSGYDEKTALSAFYALEQKGGVNLYHIWGVSPNESVLPVANARKRPVVSETSMIGAARGRPYVVVASRTGYAAAELLVQAFVKKGWKKVGIIVTQIPYYTDVADAFVELGPKYGVTVDILDQVSPDEQDFKSALLKSKGKNYAAVGPLLLVDQILSFCQQAKTLRLELPIFGGHIHNSIDLMTQCLPLSEGALIPGAVVEKAFRDRYLARFKNDMRLDSAAGSYETARVIAELFGNADSRRYTPEQIIEKFKTVNRRASAIGPFRYSELPREGKRLHFHEMALTFKNKQIVPFE